MNVKFLEGLWCKREFWVENRIPYCPGKCVPLGARNSSTKNRGWAVTRKRCLNGSSVPTQAATSGAKLAARVYRIDLHRPCLVKASPMEEKPVS